MKKVKLLFLLALLLVAPLGVAGAKKATLFHPETNDRVAVNVGSQEVQQYFADDYILEVSYGYVENDGDMLGYSVITNYYKYLSQSMSATQTTIPVTSMETDDGHTITMADFGSKVFLVVDPDSDDYREIIMCEGITGTSWSSCNRGLSFYGTSTASITANKKTHNSGAIVIITNTHYIFEEFMDKDSDETIGGNKTFSGNVDFTNLPTSTTTAPTSDSELVNKKYVDDTSAAGSPDGSEITKGIWEGATRVEMASSTATGGTGAGLVLKSEYATSSPDVRGLNVIVSENDGYMDQDWIDLDEHFHFTTTTIDVADIIDLDIDGKSVIANKTVKDYIAGQSISERDICMLRNITEEYDTGIDDKNIANVNAVKYVAQGFQVPADVKVFKGSVRLKKSGSPSSNLLIAIFDDNAGSPGNQIQYVEIDKDHITTSYTTIHFILDYGISLTANTQYHLVFVRLDAAVDASDYYIIESDTTGSYAYGQTKQSSDGPNWNDDGSRDLKFKIYYVGVMKADNDNDDVNTGARIVVADENVAKRAFGTFILEGLKDGFDFDMHGVSSANIYYRTTDGEIASINNVNDYATQSFVNIGDYLNLDEVTTYLHRGSGWTGSFSIDVYRVGSNGLPSGGSLCGTTGVGADLTTGTAGTPINFVCNAEMSPGEQFSVKVKMTADTGTNNLRVSGRTAAMYGTGNFYSSTGSPEWPNYSAKMTVSASNPITHSIGKFLYTSTTAGGYAKTGKYSIGMIVDQDTLQIGKKPGMEYLSSETISTPGDDYGYRNWVAVPVDAETVIARIYLEGPTIDSYGALTLTRSGITTAIHRDCSEAGASQNFYQADLEWINNYIEMAITWYSGGYQASAITFYFYK